MMTTRDSHGIKALGCARLASRYLLTTKKQTEVDSLTWTHTCSGSQRFAPDRSSLVGTPRSLGADGTSSRATIKIVYRFTLTKETNRSDVKQCQVSALSRATYRDFAIRVLVLDEIELYKGSGKLRQTDDLRASRSCL